MESVGPILFWGACKIVKLLGQFWMRWDCLKKWRFELETIKLEMDIWVKYLSQDHENQVRIVSIYYLLYFNQCGITYVTVEHDSVRSACRSGVVAQLQTDNNASVQ
jgi:hypothetical protein